MREKAFNISKLDDFKVYLETRSLSKNYYNIMRIFLSDLAQNDLLDDFLNDYNILSQEMITNFFNRHQEYSISTKNQFIKAGRMFFKFVGIEDNEWKKIPLMKVERKIPNYINENELGEAISYLITYHGNIISSIKAEALFRFMFYSGARKAEILGLKRADFDFEENTAKVYGKGKKERFVYYPNKAKEKITAYFNSEIEQNNAFNLVATDLPYFAKLLSKHLNKHITTHLFRHSGARHMIDKGIPLGTVSRILGHASISTTILYTDPNEATIRRQYQERMK
jgi:site-specific recombinase XerD